MDFRVRILLVLLFYGLVLCLFLGSFFAAFGDRFSCVTVAHPGSVLPWGFLWSRGRWISVTGRLLVSWGGICVPGRRGEVGFWLLGFVVAVALPVFAVFAKRPLGYASPPWVRLRAPFFIASGARGVQVGLGFVRVCAGLCF